MAGLTLKQQQFVSAYIGKANGNATEAARQAGYRGNDNTLHTVGTENLHKPAIAAAIDEYRAAIRSEGIANKQYRVDLLNDMAGRLRRTVEARAADASMQDVPGGPEGVIVRQAKIVKVYTAHTPEPDEESDDEILIPQKETRIVYEYAVDTGTLAELRATLKQAAQEKGEWSEKSDVSLDASSDFLSALRTFASGAESSGHSGPGEDTPLP